MPRASRRTETPPQHLVPDVLAPGLDLVFCGTAPSPISFKRRAYYANPGNSFWSTLHRVGLLPERFAPERYPEVLQHGIGLTDLNKTEYGSDHELTPAALDAASVRAKLLAFKPAAVACIWQSMLAPLRPPSAPLVGPPRKTWRGGLEKS